MVMSKSKKGWWARVTTGLWLSTSYAHTHWDTNVIVVFSNMFVFMNFIFNTISIVYVDFIDSDSFVCVSACVFFRNWLPSSYKYVVYVSKHRTLYIKTLDVVWQYIVILLRAELVLLSTNNMLIKNDMKPNNCKQNKVYTRINIWHTWLCRYCQLVT